MALQCLPLFGSQENMEKLSLLCIFGRIAEREKKWINGEIFAFLIFRRPSVHLADHNIAGESNLQ